MVYWILIYIIIALFTFCHTKKRIKYIYIFKIFTVSIYY